MPVLGIPLYNDYEGQITEQPAWMVMNAVHLAGGTPTEHGFLIDPHLARFSLCLAQVGVARAQRLVRGYVRIERRESLVMQIGGVPRGARSITAWADGLAVAHRATRGRVIFVLPAVPGRAADWAVTWR